MKCAAYLTLFLLSSALAFEADQIVGKWKLDTARSTHLSDITGRVMTISKTGPNTFDFTFDTTTKDGKTSQSTESRVCDGKEHPNQINKSTTYTCTVNHSLFKRDGKAYMEFTSTFAKDGKTFSNVVKTWDKDGKVTESVRAFERQ